MSAQLLVRLAVQPAEDQFWFLPTEGTPQPLDAGEAAQRSRKTPALVLLDARGLRLDWLDLPPGVKPQEAPLLLEEQLAQPLEAVEVWPLQKQGRRLQTVTLDRHLTEQWQARVADWGLKVKRWLPENLAFSGLSARLGTGEDLCISEAGWVWYYASARDQLLVLPDHLLPSQGMGTHVGGNTAVSPQPSSQLPEGALLPFLAQGLPKGLNLWPQSLLSAVFPSLVELRRWQRPLLTWGLPWLLMLLLLIGLGVLGAMSPSRQTADPAQLDQLAAAILGEKRPANEVAAAVELRLQLLQAQRLWQQDLLEVWAGLEALLAQQPQWRLQALTLEENHLLVRLDGVSRADRALLEGEGSHRRLRWHFREEQATGTLTH